MEKDLDRALIEYGKTDIYPFHMPGHKRQRLGDFVPEDIDITEVEGFDDLHHAAGILREAQERLADVFGADESCYLVDGSTAGILAAVCGCVGKGGRLLIGRDCHRSVYHAAYLTQARLDYLCPERACAPDAPYFAVQGSIPPERVEEALRRFPDTQAVVIPSPTYDGVVSDIRAIADIVHARQIPLIVDEAHGAHFGFADCFPPKAIALGADLCVESLHKTLPAYTQSAALHWMRTGRFDPERVRRYLSVFQSSSPSYLLMAGIDRCVRLIREDRARYLDPASGAVSRFGQFEMRLEQFYGECGALRAVRIFPYTNARTGAAAVDGIYERDPSKILISAEEAGLHGPQLYDLLLETYHLQMEMAAPAYVVALTSVMDTDEGFARLLRALFEIDRSAGHGRCAGDPRGTEDAAEAAGVCPFAVKRMELARAMDAAAEPVGPTQAAGRIAAEFLYLYPPGTPLVVPGEEITREVLGQIAFLCSRGMRVCGTREDGRIRVVAEKEVEKFAAEAYK